MLQPLTSPDLLALKAVAAYARGEAYADCGAYAQALLWWVRGASVWRPTLQFSLAQELERMHRLEHPGSGRACRYAPFVPSVAGPRPIFIVGHARSGSTLLEQILCSHPLVHGGGELSLLAAAVDGGGDDDSPGRYLDGLRDLTDKPFCTDKELSHFVHVGFILQALPDAIVIHAVRDPLDTCLSAFGKLFESGQDHTFNLHELAAYFCAYRDLMQHWHRKFPNRILDVHYEDVVADLEGETRRVLKHCGLEFDARCLRFDENERPVTSASRLEVRQPINHKRVGWSRNYLPHLRPLVAKDACWNRIHRELGPQR